MCELVDCCEDALCRKLEDDTVFPLLVLADQFNTPRQDTVILVLVVQSNTPRQESVLLVLVDQTSSTLLGNKLSWQTRPVSTPRQWMSCLFVQTRTVQHSQLESCSACPGRLDLFKHSQVVSSPVCSGRPYQVDQFNTPRQSTVLVLVDKISTPMQLIVLLCR